jgi:glycosyltransferase 2 family protein
MRHNTLLLIFIGLGILLLMILFIGPSKIENAIEKADTWYILLAIILQFAIYGVWTERWSITTSSLGISVRKKDLLPMLLVGLSINNLTPGRGGGEPVRAYILSKYSKTPTENAFATVIADRGLDIFPFLFLAIITIISAFFFLKLPGWMFITLIVALVLLIVIFVLSLYMSLNRKFANKVIKWFLKIIKRIFKKRHSKIEQKLLDAVEGFQNSMWAMITDRKVLMYGIPISFLIWGMEILRVYIVFFAFHVQAPLSMIAAVFVIATLIGMIPFIPGGLGAVDAIMIILYSSVGIPPSVSAAATIVERLISFWMTSILGLTILPYYGAEAVEKLSSKL